MGKRYIINNRNLIDAKQALRLADTDALTGLYNRRWLNSYYNKLDRNIKLHFMYIDVDFFKRVNDLYGHSMGDAVIKYVGMLIRSYLGDSLVTRIGGDEFVVLINGDYSEQEVEDMAAGLLKTFSESDFRKDILSLISLSIGIVLNQTVNISLDDVLYKCDAAMYQAKSDGKNRYVVYTVMEKSMEISKNIESEMEGALANREFQIYLQPKVNMITSNLIGAEALSRWIHPVDGLRAPFKYIPLFEKNGFIIKLDMYVFEEVCRLKKQWHDDNCLYASLPISVNMSRLHLYKKDFCDTLAEIAGKYDINPKELEIEITENVFLRDNTELINVVNKLHEYGFSVSIDDFGSGYSALNMLKDIPVNIIKIDKEFLKMSADDVRGKKVIKNIIAMCKDLKLDVVTEGVETEDQIRLLTSCGCEIAQGFYYSKPLPELEFENYSAANYKDDQNCIKFSFNDSFVSDDGEYEGNFIGNNYRFEPGISDSIKALHFESGSVFSNYLNLPTKLLHSDSYSVSMWLKPEKNTTWASALFGEYENGFFSFCPLAWEGHCSYRVRDARQAEAFYDTNAVNIWENLWTHVVITYNSIIEKTSLYINGILVATMLDIPSLYPLNLLTVGGDVYQVGYHGSICELTFYNHVLSFSDIASLHEKYVTAEDFTGFDASSRKK
ncbi:MAG: EAL domain-containing protein [Lachnospiraceae bacterium]|nr:EAL domain-containing protein [Lachnospiraceae bacterium]